MPRINSYHRPETLDAAMELLGRDETAVPMAGGTNLLPSRDARVQTVVDLQALGLDGLSAEGFHLYIGAMVPLQRLVESPTAGGVLAEAAKGSVRRPS